MTSSMETCSALLAICAGNSPVTGRRPLTRVLDVFFDCAWVNNRKAGDLKRHIAHYDVTVMHAIINDRDLQDILTSVLAMYEQMS